MKNLIPCSATWISEIDKLSEFRRIAKADFNRIYLRGRLRDRNVSLSLFGALEQSDQFPPKIVIRPENGIWMIVAQQIGRSVDFKEMRLSRARRLSPLSSEAAV